MPNTKSAERRMRSNERKHLHNRSIISALRKSEKGLRESLSDGKKADAAKALPDVLSALDKAVKSRVITRGEKVGDLRGELELEPHEHTHHRQQHGADEHWQPLLGALGAHGRGSLLESEKETPHRSEV